jgi:2-polyprenyl-6-methoxyphenol hydroxylase-like FAD-dependent oxidoreductase
MSYDLLVVGGGIAGATLAGAMAREGAKVLVAERTSTFSDRVRGEALIPWGVEEAQRLGIYQHLADTCGTTIRWWSTPENRRDLFATTRSGNGFLDFYHPKMQQCLLDFAAEAGADVRRPAEVIQVTPGEMPSALMRSGDTDQTISARLIVAADGRASRMRTMGGFSLQRDPPCTVIAGVLHRNLAIADDAVEVFLNPDRQELAIFFPLGANRFRSYFARRHDRHLRLSGAADVDAFVQCCIASGTPAEWFASAEAIGPLASYDGADSWVPHPYCNGIGLIGDAAAVSDPTYGCGLALSLRDVRVLRDHLIADSDWHLATDAYAEEHDKYYGNIHEVHDWWRRLFFDIGPQADAARARALPKIGEDPSRIPDFIGLGPDTPHDEAARRRFFGED